MATTASKIELSPAMETTLTRQRASLRKRFVPLVGVESAECATCGPLLAGDNRPACAICGPPKSALFHDQRRHHDLCGKCAAQQWEISWRRRLGVALGTA